MYLLNGYYRFIDSFFNDSNYKIKVLNLQIDGSIINSVGEVST